MVDVWSGIGLTAILLVSGAWCWRLVGHWRRTWRRPTVAAAGIPRAWRQILRKRWFLYRALPKDLARLLEGRIRVFASEKEFVGCQGLEVTDEIKVLISAQACLMEIGRESPETGYFPDVTSILVYPEDYRATSRHYEDGLVLEQEEIRSGESWAGGAVVLSWSAIQNDLRSGDGHNVVIHEFAHQLDSSPDGVADGRPEIAPQISRSWADVFSREFESLQQAAHEGTPTILDHYGAGHPAEFFAVVSESFFEESRQLKERHPDLHALMVECYRLDPSLWMTAV